MAQHNVGTRLGNTERPQEERDPNFLTAVRIEIAQDAARGVMPTHGAWGQHAEEAFEGKEEALAGLWELATRVNKERAEADRVAAERRVLQDETQRVLKEWDEAEQAKRLAKAETEARKRLGL